MINIEQAVLEKFPGFAKQPGLIRRPAFTLLKKLTYQEQVNAFLQAHARKEGFEFIDAVFEYFNFSYSVSARDKTNIPAEGRVVIIANHPIGSLDGLALLRLVSEVRTDVKVLANDMLARVSALNSLLIPYDNLGSGSARRSYRAALEALAQEQAVIVFPAGEVSRARPNGVRDTRWRPGFLHFARKSHAPILPVHIVAKNSLLFYSASMLFKPLGTALLAHEMFNKRECTIEFRIGETIPPAQLHSNQVHDRTLLKRLRKHLYKVGRRGNPIFETERTIAHPEDRRVLQQELAGAQLLGQTRDDNRIYLFDAFPNSAVMREIGRLREIAFRKVGEGTGARCDIDSFDAHYRHLVLWDREKLQIAGAYRLGEGRKILAQYGEAGFYTHSLYRFAPEFRPYLESGVELGRSFVNPDYWGKASLDYLWQGLGAYLAHQPEIRYLMGPVSMSAQYPRDLMDTLVYFYRRYYGCPETLATAWHPYELQPERVEELDRDFGDREGEEAFDFMQQCFAAKGHRLPILFKQYAALFEVGGFQSLVFSVDPDFGDCLDGMCMGDLSRLKASRRKRYIDRHEQRFSEDMA